MTNYFFSAKVFLFLKKAHIFAVAKENSTHSIGGVAELV